MLRSIKIMKCIYIALDVPDFGWNIITHCAYHYSCWFECLYIINNYLEKILSIPEHTTKYRAREGFDIIEISCRSTYYGTLLNPTIIECIR